MNAASSSGRVGSGPSHSRFTPDNDGLTALPTRPAFVRALDGALCARAHGAQRAFVLLVDIEGFRSLNFSFGYGAGDALLRSIARRLQEWAPSGAMLARSGSDEFMLLLRDGGDGGLAETMHAHACALIAALTRPLLVGNRLLRPTVHVGATSVGAGCDSLDAVLRRADSALAEARARGSNMACLFERDLDPGLGIRSGGGADNIWELRDAIDKGQFLLHYQPQVDHQGRLVGVEGLVRWRHPQRGMVAPSAFIPLAEQSGLVVALGDQVLRMACAQLVRWRDEPRLRQASVSVNVSARQFRQRDFVDRVARALADSGAAPTLLKLELTESLPVDDIEDTVAKMEALKALGVGFSMDDFGTGYSCLAFLKRLPLDQLKIDQTFVHDMLEDPCGAAIARSVIALAHGLGLDVIAEGVELPEQRVFLEENGCRLYQGYLFSPPLAPADLEAYAARLPE